MALQNRDYDPFLSQVLVGSIGTGTASSNSVTINALRGTITTESLTTGTASVTVIDLVNNLIDPNVHQVFCSLLKGTNTNGRPYIGTIDIGTGSCTITIGNSSITQALNGTVKVSYQVL